MTDRLTIAAMCLQGLLAGNFDSPETAAYNAVIYADALLEEHRRTEPKRVDEAVEWVAKNLTGNDLAAATAAVDEILRIINGADQ